MSKSKTKTKPNHVIKFTQMVTCASCHGVGAIRRADHVQLRAARVKKGVSVRTLAKRMKVSAPFISDVELGRRGCPDYILKGYQRL